MAEAAEAICTRLELSDGGRVFLRSVWEVANFSIVVLDGVHAWSRGVSCKEVLGIARRWNIDVGEFMRSARSRLSCQHPTSSYSISADKDVDVVQLSCTIDDLWEGEALNFELRLERMSDVGAVVCGMLNHLVDTNYKLKEQLMETENRFQKKLLQFAADEPEPSISLSLAHPSVNSRRQISSLVEPRVHGLHLDTSKIPSRQSPCFDLENHGTMQTASSNAELEREIAYLNSLTRSRLAHGGMLRSNDLTVHHEAFVGFGVPLSSNILRVVASLGGAGTVQRTVSNRGPVGTDEEMGGSRDDRSLKITEMRSTHRDEEWEKSFMFDSSAAMDVPKDQPRSNADIAADATRASNCTRVLEENQAHKKVETMNRNGSSEMKKIQGNRNLSDANGVVQEKRSSNAGESERSQERGLNKSAEDEARGGSEEERSSKVSSQNARLGHSTFDSGFRAKAGLPELSKWGQWVSEAKITEEKHANCQEQMKPADSEARCGSGRVEYLESPRNRKSTDIPVPPSITKCDEDLVVTESFTKDDTPECAHQKSVLPPVVEHQGRKRSMQDGEDDPRSKILKAVKQEVEDSDFEGRESTYGFREGMSRRHSRRFNKNGKQKVVVIDDFPEETQAGRKHNMTRETFLVAREAAPKGRATIADLLKVSEEQGFVEKGIKAKILGHGSPRKGRHSSEKKHRRKCRGDCSPPKELYMNLIETNVPDADYYDFDKHRTEAHIKSEQIWAVYDDIDGMPRTWARIEKVRSSPKFKALVTWLKPRNPSEGAVLWRGSSGYPITCGEFEFGEQDTLFEINCFSHKMMVDWVSTKVVQIYPNKGEVWALFKKAGQQHSTSTSPETIISKGGGSPKPHATFRLVEILEDVKAGKSPDVQVLGRVKGYRTVWSPSHSRGLLPVKILSLFSHRIPAHRLQGDELRNIPEECWDIDPAGLPCEGQGDA